jgi:hypothetical protein
VPLAKVSVARLFMTPRRRIALSARSILGLRTSVASVPRAATQFGVTASFLGSLALSAPALAMQPPMGGGGMPGGGAGPAPGGEDKDKKKGPAEEAPRDKSILRPIEPVPATPPAMRRLVFFDIHGYLRMRADWFYRLDLGTQRGDGRRPSKFYPPAAEIPETSDDQTLSPNNANCYAQLDAKGVSPGKAGKRCDRRHGLSNANMRLRMTPSLNISEKVKIHTTIDALDNLVLGSTPDSYLGQNPWAPIDTFTRSQDAPSAGVNGWDDSIIIRRVYGDINFGWGLNLKFGRMPNQWGMGLLRSDGNGYARGEKADIVRMVDTDYGDSVDTIRLAYDFGTNPEHAHRLTLGFNWASSGPTTAQLLGPGWNSGQRTGQTISVERHDDVKELFASVERRDEMDALKRKLSLDLPVFNYGATAWLRWQPVARSVGAPGYGDGLGTEPFKTNGADPGALQNLGAALGNGGIDREKDNGLENYAENLELRRALFITPDIWLRANWRTLRFEFEAGGNFGHFYTRDLSINRTSTQTPLDTSTSVSTQKTVVNQWGYALEFKLGAFNDRLNFGLDQGFASGDKARPVSVDNASPWTEENGRNGTDASVGDNSLKSFRFNPSYAFDILLFRELLGAPANTAYFKPWISYAFFDENLSFRFDVLYAMAHQRKGTPNGEKRGYGVEVDGALRYHDQQEPIFVQAQYGLLFPLGALDTRSDSRGKNIRPVQTLQAQIGIRF